MRKTISIASTTRSSVYTIDKRLILTSGIVGVAEKCLLSAAKRKEIPRIMIIVEEKNRRC